jgi:hypothetical protein
MNKLILLMNGDGSFWSIGIFKDVVGLLLYNAINISVWDLHRYAGGQQYCNKKLFL